MSRTTAQKTSMSIADEQMGPPGGGAMLISPGARPSVRLAISFLEDLNSGLEYLSGSGALAGVRDGRGKREGWRDVHSAHRHW